MNSVIELSGARKIYRRGSENIIPVDSVTLSIAAGDFVAIVGPSGSGKTTLLNLIGCLDTPDSGVVRIDGEDTRGLNEHALTAIRARKIGFVFQQFFLLPTLTAQENVQLPALFLHNGDQAERAVELLERVGLSGRTTHAPAQLSGGEMQRVAIARALINQPKILLADEPTGNLDSRNAQTILAIFRGLNVDGLTVVMVTHNAELAHQAMRTLYMKEGKIDPMAPTTSLAGTTLRRET